MNYDGQNEIDLRHLFGLLLSRLWFLLLTAIIGAGAGFAVSKFLLPVEYSSHISMYVQSYTIFSESPDELVTQTNNISNSKQLINTYIQVLKDDEVLDAVAEKLTEQFDAATLGNAYSLSEGVPTASSIRRSLSITTVTDTSALNVKVTTTDAELCAAVCNELAKVAPDYLRQAVGVGSISTIGTAKVYSNPVAPNTKRNIALGGMIGFIFAAMIVFLIDFFDNTIKETDGLTQKYNKAIIGEISEFEVGKKKRRKKKSGEDAHVRLTDPDVPFSVVESYKSIRTNINFALSTFDRKIFAVSSANPGEGKSTMSANIAIALAQGGNRVLLIDADMRKAVQHKIFGISNKRGLSSAISKMSKLQESIRKDVMENLDILPSGPIPPNPSELLASGQMRTILEKLSEEYAVIVIDTPPINVVTDAMELSDSIAGIVMVLRYAMTSFDDTEAAMKRIELANMNMLGFILNDVKHRSGAYYSKYKYKYKYGKYGKYDKYGYGYGYGYTAKPEAQEGIDDPPETADKDEKAAKTEKTDKNGKRS